MLHKIESMKIKEIFLKGWCANFPINTKKFSYIEVEQDVVRFINKRKKSKIVFPRNLIILELKNGEQCA